MELQAVTISFRVTGLVPSARDGTSSSGDWRTPRARATSATRAGPTCCMTCAVMVFLENARPSASVMGWSLGGPPSVGRQTRPPPRGISTGPSISVSLGDAPLANAAPYTKGLNVEPGWRRAACTWSNGSCAQSRLPTHASTWPATGYCARKPACTRVFSARSGLVGNGLQARVDGGADHQAIGIQVVAMAVGPLDELLAQLYRKVGRWAHDLGLALEIDAQRAFLQGLQLLFFELAALDHLRQHGVAPCLGTLGVEHGVVVGRALEHADQRGAFQHVELVGRLVEIRARGHLDTVGVVEERHGVEVSLQDLVLGVRRLDLARGDRLLELAREGLREHARAPDLLRNQVACQLLRDGGATLRVPA